MAIGIEQLMADLRGAGFVVDGPVVSNNKPFAIVRKYLIVAGRFAHQTVDLAIPAPPDYPSTTPGGLYVSPCIAEVGKVNVHDPGQETAGLPGPWQYWSRPMTSKWQPARAGKCFIAHWNAVFAHYA